MGGDCSSDPGARQLARSISESNLASASGCRSSPSIVANVGAMSSGPAGLVYRPTLIWGPMKTIGTCLSCS